MNQDFFDRVFVINLDRRPDRWEAVQDRLRDAKWPFKWPERFSAIDGNATGVPVWWGQGGGAWGCLMSHCRIIEQCVKEKALNVLFLEDDCTFCEDFVEKVQDFLSRIPDDWDHLYLGGQHLLDPKDHPSGVFECRNVNRTHAHAMNSSFMRRAYRHVLNAPDYLRFKGQHVDHRLGALHETGTVKVYAPREWLCGQVEGSSDISGRENPTFFWNTWRDVPAMPMYVILDVHCGVGQKVAHLAKTAGLHLGHTLGGSEYAVEDQGLMRICERVYPFPATTRKLRETEISGEIHDFVQLILQEASNYGVRGGLHYPHVCAMYADFERAWKNFRVINVESDLDAATSRLFRRSETASDHWLRAGQGECKELQAFLYRKKKEWLSNCPSITIDQEEVASEARVIDRIKAFMAENESRSVSSAG